MLYVLNNVQHYHYRHYFFYRQVAFVHNNEQSILTLVECTLVSMAMAVAKAFDSLLENVALVALVAFVAH